MCFAPVPCDCWSLDITQISGARDALMLDKASKSAARKALPYLLPLYMCLKTLSSCWLYLLICFHCLLLLTCLPWDTSGIHSVATLVSKIHDTVRRGLNGDMARDGYAVLLNENIQEDRLKILPMAGEQWISRKRGHWQSTTSYWILL